MRFFLDASVLYAMAVSPTGGARELVRLVDSGTVTLVVSKYVFDEAETALLEKQPGFVRVIQIARTQSFWEYVFCSPREVREAKAFVSDPDDAPILAAAKKARVDALVSFDRKHLHTQSVEGYIGAPIITAGDALIMLRKKGLA